MNALKVMVVEDSIITIKKLTLMLEGMGHRVVHTCNSGVQACSDYIQMKPDLITMDITMPDMNGIEATRNIVKDDQDAKILMVTSHGQEQMVMDAIEAGALGYVLKPIKEDKLKRAIEKLCLSSEPE